jgi:formate hydrogenlyase subunit 3/multisubunit Na+/H+ antiporter MnhD subunit
MEVILPNDLLIATAVLWVAAAIIALSGAALTLARLALGLGGVLGILAAIVALPSGTSSAELPMAWAGEAVTFQMAPEALWLMGFGLVPAVLACCLATPAREGRAGWLFGAAVSLLGALGVFGVQHCGALLIAWELMSLGGAVMLLSERLTTSPGAPVLFMLGLLEVGAVALLLAFLLLTEGAKGLSFDALVPAAAALPVWLQIAIGILLVTGFGAKLGLLPFYEWFPGAYGSGSGASGAIMSGVVLNAAFFALSRSLLGWLPGHPPGGAYGLGIFVVAVGVLSAILAILYAFQQDDWRDLLSFSSAENAAIAVTTLGAAIMFRDDGQADLAGLAWTVSLLHLAGHALAKGGLFLTSDGVFLATSSYAIRQSRLAKRTSWIFGVGALFAAMSLAAMPPQAGFVSEWYVFQTVFQGFHLSGLAGRLVLALAGAGLALTAAVAFATFVKVLGIGLFGGADDRSGKVPPTTVLAVGFLGLCVLALAVGMPIWLSALTGATASHFGGDGPQAMHDGLLLVPLTAKFAFISPSMLVVAMPLLALIPIALVLISMRARPRRTRVWYGGVRQNMIRTPTTALTFSNALRTFYSFIYRPTAETTRESSGREYFVTRLVFTHDVAPVFGPYLFAPAVRLVRRAAEMLRVLQSGHLNLYLATIGLLLVVILGLTLL